MKLLNVFRKRKALPTNDEKIAMYKQEIQGVFSQFKRMNDRLDEVNFKIQEVVKEELISQEVEQERLKQVIEETNKRLEESMNRVENANKEIEANKKLQEKVKEFII